MNEAARGYLAALMLLAAIVIPAAVAVAFPTPWSPMGQAANQTHSAEGR